MKKQIFCVAGILTLVVSGSARASLVSVDIIAGPPNPDGIHATWRVVARFSDPGDQISAVNGVADNPIDFLTCDGTDVYNQAIFGGVTLNDFPTVGLGGEAWDTYVTIGATNFQDDNTQFSPNFLGDWGNQPPPEQVILGSAFEESDGAWFNFGAPLVVSEVEDIEGNDFYDAPQTEARSAEKFKRYSTISFVAGGIGIIAAIVFKIIEAPYVASEATVSERPINIEATPTGVAVTF